MKKHRLSFPLHALKEHTPIAGLYLFTLRVVAIPNSVSSPKDCIHLQVKIDGRNGGIPLTINLSNFLYQQSSANKRHLTFL